MKTDRENVLDDLITTWLAAIIGMEHCKVLARMPDCTPADTVLVKRAMIDFKETLEDVRFLFENTLGDTDDNAY